jgi:hypothetical protein
MYAHQGLESCSILDSSNFELLVPIKVSMMMVHGDLKFTTFFLKVKAGALPLN